MDFFQIWAGGADVTFTAILTLTLLVVLYAMALMNRALRLLQYQVSVIETDLKLMEEEIKMTMAKEKPTLDQIKGVDVEPAGR